MVNVFTQLLTRELEPMLNGQTREHSLIVQKNVRRMEQLLRDLLQFSRHVHQSGASSAVDLNESLAAALAVLQHRVQEEVATVTFDSLPTVRAEATPMVQVFQNLIGNALKYRKPDEPPRIHISARQTGSEWIVSVQDNGIGFPQEQAERIFGLFKRLHFEEYPGTGIGLAICKRVIERSGGRIWAESQPGAGSTFFVALPVYSQALSAEQPQDTHAPAGPR